MNYIKKIIRATRAFRCPIPIELLRHLGIDPEGGKVLVTLEGNKIIITKYEEENVSNRRAVNE